MFTAEDFGFGADDENLPNPDHDPGQNPDEDCEEPETMENLRRATLTPPMGLFGGSPFYDEDLNLHLSDSSENEDDEMAGPSASPDMSSSTPRKQHSLFCIF